MANFFARADPAGGSWPYLIWRDAMLKNGRDPGRDKPADMPKPPPTFLWIARDPKAAWPYRIQLVPGVSA